MYLTIKQNLKHLSKHEYRIIKKLCRISKNLRNQALYEIRQEYFNNKKYLNYKNVYPILKTSENYKLLQSNMAQQILKSVDAQFKSFFGSLKSSNVKHKVKIPYYLPKDGYAQLIIQQISIVKGCFQVPYSRTFSKTHEKIYIKIPSILANKQIKEIKITPLGNARYFEISYGYEAEDISKVELDNNKALAIDLGIDNLCTCASSEGKTFIIDGRKLKSINQWFNKETSRLQSIKDKQKHGKANTRRQIKLSIKRANRIRNYLGKTAKKIIQYCLDNQIKHLVLSKNNDFQLNSNMGKRQNQVFVNIPYGQLKSKLQYQCKRYGINFVEQEESYTSKASFWDRDEIPVYNKDFVGEYKFSGRRIYRGLYRTSNGTLINADVNGALNILRKSNVVSLDTLYSRGELSTPIRIRIA